MQGYETSGYLMSGLKRQYFFFIKLMIDDSQQHCKVVHLSGRKSYTESNTGVLSNAFNGLFQSNAPPTFWGGAFLQKSRVATICDVSPPDVQIHFIPANAEGKIRGKRGITSLLIHIKLTMLFLMISVSLRTFMYFDDQK